MWYRLKNIQPMFLFRKKVSLLIFFVLSWVLSCDNQVHSNAEEINVNNLKEGENLFIDEIVDSITIQRLETKSNSLISDWADQIILTPDRIIVLSISPQCKISFFNRNTGEFINKLTASGEGPGEFTRFTYATYNPYKNHIEIFASFQRKVLFFDLNGNFLEEKPQYMFADSKGYLTESISVYMFSTSSNTEFSGKETSHRIVLHNSKQNTFDYFYPISKKELEMVHLMTPYNFNLLDRELIWFENLNNNILSIKNRQVSFKYKINFTKNTLPVDFWQKNTKYSSMVEALTNENIPFLNSFFFESKKYCLFTYEYNETLRLAVYDKKNKKTIINTPRVLYKKWKLALPIPIHANQGNLVFLINANDFKGLIESHPDVKLLPKAFLDMSRMIKSTDNPIVLTIKIK